MKWLFIASIGFSVGKRLSGVNIFQNFPRIIGEKFLNFLGSWEEFDEIQFCACFFNLGWRSVNYLAGNFAECKEEYYPIKGYCFKWWRGIKWKQAGAELGQDQLSYSLVHFYCGLTLLCTFCLFPLLRISARQRKQESKNARNQETKKQTEHIRK